MGIKVRTRHWTKDSYSESGGKPQNLLNKQFVVDCDLTIALFWTRFGTPTDDWGSGTEEEIEIMLENGKQVFVGFSDISIPPSNLTDDEKVKEYQRVQEFRKRYQDRGIYFVYSSIEDLKRIFSAHLSKHFIIKNEQDKAGAGISPKLSVQAITETGLQNNITIYNFGESVPLITPLERVREYFDKINEYEIYDHTPVNLLGILGSAGEMKNLFQTKAKFDASKQKYIRECADALKIELKNNFFSLGDLKKNTLTTTPPSGPSLIGTEFCLAQYLQSCENNHHGQKIVRSRHRPYSA